MAYDKIKQNYKDIADAIREKTGENGLMTAEEIPDKISDMVVPHGILLHTTTTRILSGSDDAGADPVPSSDPDYSGPEWPKFQPSGVPGSSPSDPHFIYDGFIDVRNYEYIAIRIPYAICRAVSKSDFTARNWATGVRITCWNEGLCIYAPNMYHRGCLFKAELVDTANNTWEIKPYTDSRPDYDTTIWDTANELYLPCIATSGGEVLKLWIAQPNGQFVRNGKFYIEADNPELFKESAAYEAFCERVWYINDAIGSPIDTIVGVQFDAISVSE